MTPRAREEALLVREVEDETLVYDLKRHKAHSLNQTAALVWRWCDGQTTIAEMARRLREEAKIAADEDAVWLALEGLGRARLLQERATRPGDAERVSRRAVARKLGLTAGLTLLLPVVMSIIAPTPALAASCIRDILCSSITCGSRCMASNSPQQCTTNFCSKAANGTGSVSCRPASAAVC